MIIIPRENPVLQNLNSFYLNIENFIDHFKQEIETGCLHFKSFSNEGAIFFGEDSFQSGLLKTKKGTISGDKAIEVIKSASPKSNFKVSVYKISPGRVYYWANISNAQEMYKGLSSEFTDLEGLSNKMSSEKLTGYIDVKINKTKENGLIYFLNGDIIGGYFSWENTELNRIKECRDQLIKKSRDHGGIFTVLEIPIQNSNPTRKVIKSSSPAAVKKNKEAGKQKAKEKDESTPRKEINALEIVQKLLNITENTIKTNKKTKTDFDILLRKKFVSKVADYEFLDPFTAEFQYIDSKVTYIGDATNEDIVNGVSICVKELSKEEKVFDTLIKNLEIWLENYSDELKKLNVNFTDK